MTNRERILAVLRGEIPDRIPWAPRLDFWLRARRRRGTLPAGLRDRSLREIVDQLGAAYYSICPDATECDESEMADLGLGIFGFSVLPYRVVMRDVERIISHRENETQIEYRTPVGSLHVTTVMTPEMLDGGASMPWTAQHAIREPKDLDTAAYIFSHLEVQQRTEGYLKTREQVGERGIVAAVITDSASPIDHIMKSLMPAEQFFYALHDEPQSVAGLAEAMEPYYAAMQCRAAESPAEVVLFGASYDDRITPPPFFREHILPALRNYSGVLHKKGKYLLTHTDGESRRLLPLLREAGIDIAESVCPAPMTSLRLDEFFALLGDDRTIWGGIPSIVLCPEVTPWGEFRGHIDRLLADYGHRGHFVLGVSDMVTAEAEWDRLRYISDAVGELAA
jgi:hypothetical protein